MTLRGTFHMLGRQQTALWLAQLSEPKTTLLAGLVARTEMGGHRRNGSRPMSPPMRTGRDTAMVPDRTPKRELNKHEPRNWYSLVTMLISLARLVLEIAAERH